MFHKYKQQRFYVWNINRTRLNGFFFPFKPNWLGLPKFNITYYYDDFFFFVNLVLTMSSNVLNRFLPLSYAVEHASVPI